MKRGMAITAVTALVLGSGVLGTVIWAGARTSEQIHSTRVIIKETERVLIHERIETGDYTPELDRIPRDAWGRPLLIQVPGPQGRPYHLVSYGADGTPGGRGRNADISNWEF